jgi:hypothetical protein
MFGDALKKKNQQLEQFYDEAAAADDGLPPDDELQDKIPSLKVLKPKFKRDKTKIKNKTMMKNDALRQAGAVDYHKHEYPAKFYIIMCYYARLVNISENFNSYIFFCIILAGTLVGIQTYESMEDNIIVKMLDDIVLFSFSVEIICKIMSEGVYSFLLP